MENIKRQYQAPALVDQGSVVSRTMATKSGENWDGSPYEDDDTKTGTAVEPVGVDPSAVDVPSGAVLDGDVSAVIVPSV